MHEEWFRYKTPNAARLAAYGFLKTESGYRYTTSLLDRQFIMTVTVSVDGEVTSVVTDAASGEEYVLYRVPGACGAFVGQVREAHEAVLRDVSERCFDRDVFRSEQARALIAYVRDTYGDDLQYLWQRFPTNAVWRRADNAVWYGALLVLERGKVGLAGDGMVDILDIRADAAALVDGVRYLPGYHMNKTHWVTVPLDGTLPLVEICRRVDESYATAGGKARRK